MKSNIYYKGGAYGIPRAFDITPPIAFDIVYPIYWNIVDY